MKLKKSFVVTSLSVAITVASFFFLITSAKADSLNWTSSAPTVTVDSARSTSGRIISNNLQICQPTTISVYGQSQVSNACTVQALSFQLAFYTYCTNFWFGSCYSNAQGMAIRQPNDSNFHQIINPGGALSSNWKVSTDTDTLLYNDGSTTFVIKDLLSKLTPSQGNFTLNTGAQRYLSVDSSGNLVNWAGSANMSANGQWAALELKGDGQALINLNDFTYKLFTNDATPYGMGMNPSYEYAISNDGKFVANGGTNVAFKVYDASSTCGDTATSGLNPAWNTQHPTSNPCPARSYDPGIVQAAGNNVDRVYQTTGLTFSDDDGELDTLATTVSGGNYINQWYKLTAANYTPPTQLDYLALGDSYSSGEGDTTINPATNAKYYRPFTDNEENQAAGVPREKCHLSTRSYPYKLALSMNLGNPSASGLSRRWQSVACSGAKIGDINSDNLEYLGQSRAGLGPLAGLPRLDMYDNQLSLKATALNEFIPGRNAQIEFVKVYKPKVITLTIGGNDIGFGDKLQECVLNLFSCRYTTDEGKASLANQIAGEFDRLSSLYTALYQASGSQAKIYVLGYPQFINADPNASCPVNIGGLYTVDDRSMIVNSVTYLNNVIKTAALAAGVKYIDIEDSLNGHRLCDSGQGYMNGVVALGSDELQESFHPNVQGNAAISNAIWNGPDNVNGVSLLDYNDCPAGGGNACPNSTITRSSVPVPSYFQSSGSPSVSVENKELAPHQETEGVNTNVQAKPYVLEPNSPIHLTLHSDPVDLGTYTTNQDGSFGVNIIIPNTVPAGYHTLILTGSSFSGEPVQFEQTVLVQGSDSSDLDNNGVADTQQACGPFITPSGQDADYDGIDDACDPEITDPILYIARNGDPAKSEDPSKLYLDRNTRANSVTGITNDYVDTSLDPNNKEALVAGSLTTDTSGTFNKFVMLDNGTNPKIPTILMKDATNTCIALQPTDYLSPALNPTDPNYTPRGFTKLTQLPEGEECE